MYLRTREDLRIAITLYSKIQSMHKVGRKRRGENHKEFEEGEGIFRLFLSKYM